MSVKVPIFMDNHSTTPVDPRVLDAMLPFFREDFGNAASRNHVFGWRAEKAVEIAREEVGKLIGASAKEIVWTSGATESVNLALKGAAEFYKEKGNHIITGQTEHKATLDTCKRLEKEGCEVTYLPVDKEGIITAEQVAEAIKPNTILVALMAANNEIGSLHPVNAIGAAIKAKKKDVLFFVDAVQAAGKVPFDVSEAKVDLASVSAHKIYGPKGVGALYVRRKPRVRVVEQIDGGGHERGMRSGTLNVPGIVGFGKAAELSRTERVEEAAKLTALRNRLYAYLTTNLKEVHLNGSWEERLPGNLNVSFAYVEGEGLMMALKDVAVSSGSACTSASLEPSYVLRALGVGEEMAHSSIRFGIGRFNTEEEIDYVGRHVVEAVNRLREMSPLWEMVQEGVDLKSISWAAEH
ncbi:MAG TPA: IscS subfamily cysteine desulfurase [Polyangia bacterium]|jgi:cysteine desulfurase